MISPYLASYKTPNVYPPQTFAAVKQPQRLQLDSTVYKQQFDHIELPTNLRLAHNHLLHFDVLRVENSLHNLLPQALNFPGAYNLDTV